MLSLCGTTYLLRAYSSNDVRTNHTSVIIQEGVYQSNPNDTMGNESSQPHDPEDEFAQFDGIETLGYRVLGVQPNSPASTAGLVSFLDFLVGCNGIMLMGSGEGLDEGDEYDDVDFPKVLRDNEGKELELCKLVTLAIYSMYEGQITNYSCSMFLVVHNIKSNSQRLVKITPSSTWGGAGLLGVTIRLDNYGGADERLIRVLSVEHNSPAAIAGLTPLTDYLLGTTSASFDSDGMLAEVLYLHVDRIIEIYVYNSETDVVRVVTLMPSKSWGGRGLLGAEVGTGYLHGFPKSVRGTDGRSVERKVRMGVRPTEAIAEAENVLNRETVIKDEASGNTMCFTEQMEMELEPAESQRRSDIQDDINNPPQGSISEQTGGEFSNEADALFSRPPPINKTEIIKQNKHFSGYSSPDVPQPAPETVDLR